MTGLPSTGPRGCLFKLSTPLPPADVELISQWTLPLLPKSPFPIRYSLSLRCLCDNESPEDSEHLFEQRPNTCARAETSTKALRERTLGARCERGRPRSLVTGAIGIRFPYKSHTAQVVGGSFEFWSWIKGRIGFDAGQVYQRQHRSDVV